MNSDLDQILASEQYLTPSAGFVQRVMAAEFDTRHVTVQVENEVLQEEEKLRKT